MRVWWCEKHDSKGADTGEIPPKVCQAALNIGYRIGRNPFSRSDCRFVEMRLSTLTDKGET
jgi:hypothetical protein